MKGRISSAKRLRRLLLPVVLLGLVLLPSAIAWAKMPVTITFFNASPPVGGVAATLPSGEVLIAGGEGNDGAVTSAELYDPATDSFSELTGSGQSLTHARGGAVAAALPSGQVLIAGGNEGGNSLASAELFSPTTDSFTKLTGAEQSPTQGRQLAVAARLPSGQVLIAGCEESARCATAELFSPVTDTFTKLMGPAGSLAVARAGAVAATLPSGQVLIAGGRNDGREMQSAELFNATTDTFSELTGAGQSPTEPRFRAVAAMLPSGQVLIAGGAGNKNSPPSAELFNPATDTFTKLTGPGQSPTEARYDAVAAPLPSGEVLIARRRQRRAPYRARNCSTPRRTRSQSWRQN